MGSTTTTTQPQNMSSAAGNAVAVSLPKVGYFSMEVAIDPSLYTYSGGLGFLAGSHLLSAGDLKFPMVGVTILWHLGYGEQQVNEHGEVEIVYTKRTYPFLTDTGIMVDVTIFGEVVKVKAFRLEAERFGSVPLYYLTTDIPENKPEHRELTAKLYDGEQRTRIAQEIILGIGGFRVLEAANESIEVYHMNEGHALPALFELLDRHHGDLHQARQQAVFTTHTPVAAGNETHPAHLLVEAGFFGNRSVEEAIGLGGEDFSLTVAALRMCRIANGVSQLHGQVANNMWDWVDNRCPIVAITNAVSKKYWQDPRILDAKTDDELLRVKKLFKDEMFRSIQDLTGHHFDRNVMTIVWARRFTEYKRAGLIFRDEARIRKLLDNNKVQIIFAGKFHPLDKTGHETYNRVLALSREIEHVVMLPNYGLELSGILKRGADIWLNTPLRPLEASGTSGMGANLNGALHFSTCDGWAVEGTYDGLNGFLINQPENDDYLPVEDRNAQDYDSMMSTLENRVLPMYYDEPEQWAATMRRAMNTAASYFDSNRMAIEYYTRLYKPVSL